MSLIVVAGIPCRSEIKATCFESISWGLLEGMDWWKRTHGPDSKFGLSVVARAHVVDARLHLMEEAFKKEATHLWWIDDDMTIPQGTLERLYRNMQDTGAALSGALCYRRGEPFGPCAFSEEINPKTGKQYQINPYPERVAEVAATGFACLLMDMEQAGRVWDINAKQVFAYLKTCGEDAFYCNLARKLGQKIVVDTGLVPGHIGEVNYDGKMYAALLKERPELAANLEPQGS